MNCLCAPQTFVNSELFRCNFICSLVIFYYCELWRWRIILFGSNIRNRWMYISQCYCSDRLKKNNYLESAPSFLFQCHWLRYLSESVFLSVVFLSFLSFHTELSSTILFWRLPKSNSELIYRIYIFCNELLKL